MVAGAGSAGWRILAEEGSILARKMLYDELTIDYLFHKIEWYIEIVARRFEADSRIGQSQVV